MQDIDSFPDRAAPSQTDTAEGASGLDPRSVLRSVSAVVYDWDLVSDKLTWGANAGETLAAFPKASLISGGAFAELVTSDSESSRFQAINNSATRDAGEGAPYRASYRLARTDGSSCAVEDVGRWFADAQGRPARAHGVMRLVQRNETAGAAADTAFANRRAFNDALDARFSNVRPGDASFAVLMVGVEDLAELNRRHGYDATDEVIAAVGRRLGGNVRSIDRVAHYAGGKFAVLLSAANPEQLALAAPRLALRVNAELFETSAGPVKAAVRIGAALAPRHGRSACRLLQRAEQAYEQAVMEESRYALYTPGHAVSEAQRREAAVANEIVAALNQRRIVVAYQPIVASRSGSVAFYEALLRVRQEDGVVVGPEILLPVAERVGLITQLDQRVFELALDRLSAEPDLKVSVNISVATLRSPDWLDRMKSALGLHPGVAERLIVEIVETLAVEPIDEALRIIAQMKALGVSIAMDDFGAGHTSFRNLRRLGVDIVKIDGAFVQNVARSLDDRFFVRTLAQLARHLGIQTVAEWVEDNEARRLLGEWEIDYLQGHLLGRPEIYDPAVGALALSAAGR